MKIKKETGALVRKYRIQAGLAQEQLASDAGISHRFLQKIEAGNNLPSLVTLLKLSYALKITPEKFISPIWKEWVKSQKSK